MAKNPNVKFVKNSFFLKLQSEPNHCALEINKTQSDTVIGK